MMSLSDQIFVSLMMSDDIQEMEKPGRKKELLLNHTFNSMNSLHLLIITLSYFQLPPCYPLTLNRIETSVAFSYIQFL